VFSFEYWVVELRRQEQMQREGVQQHPHGNEDWQLPGWEMTHLLVNALHSNDNPTPIPPNYGVENSFLGFGPSSFPHPNHLSHAMHHPPLGPHNPNFLPNPLSTNAQSGHQLTQSGHPPAPTNYPSTNLSQRPTTNEPVSSFFHFINSKEDEKEIGKNRPVTEKQKSRRRASQNMASRNYRQRKKEYISSIEDKLEQLNIENERLRREVNESRHLATKLMHENTELKNTQVCDQVDSHDGEDEALNEELMNTELDLKHLIEKLDAGVTHNMDEAGITPLLKMFYQTLRKRHSIFTNQVKKIVNPCIQAKISILDSTPNEEGISQQQHNKARDINEPLSGDADGNWWVQFVKDAGITEKQEVQIKQLRTQHNSAYHQLRTRRSHLNKDIKDFYREKFFSFSSQLVGGQSPRTADVPAVIELTSKLEEMKKNLDAEKLLVLETHDALAKILTPKQEALFVTRAYTRAHTVSTDTMQMVTHMWDAISRKENALSRCCQPNWLSIATEL
jgi:Spy/CpxP family protein refolding chaperone